MVAADDEAISAIAEYMWNTGKTPTHIAMSKADVEYLYRSYGYLNMTGTKGYIYGVEVKLVSDDYSGPKVWEDWVVKNHEEPIKKIVDSFKTNRACRNCGAPARPVCDYCGS